MTSGLVKQQGRLVSADPSGLWLAAAVVAMVAGIVGNVVGGRLPGSEPLSVEDFIDAGGAVALGVLGVALLRRHRAEGLGRALLAVTVLGGAVWLTGGTADLLTAGRDPSLTARLLDLLNIVLFIPMFALLVLAPLPLFPTGTLPSRRWRWVGWVSVAGVSASMLSVALTPGPLDEDVSAWGDNPIGIPGLAGLTEALEVVGLVLLATAALAGVCVVIVRLVRYRGPRRRQMLWFLAGILPMLVGLIVDVGDSPIAQVASAAIIFAALVGGMAWALLGPLGQA